MGVVVELGLGCGSVGTLWSTGEELWFQAMQSEPGGHRMLESDWRGRMALGSDRPGFKPR